MNSQKTDNQLNLALTIPENVRDKSQELNAGYNEESKRWEVIVKYIGDLELIKEQLDVDVTELLNNYAIIVIKEEDIARLAAYEQIQYIEKPKLLSFELINALSASCISQIQRSPYNLSGRGVIVGIIDTGIDYSHPDFRNADGTTRILSLWDQTISGNPPAGYSIGTEYTAQQINQALQASTQAERQRIVPSIDLSGHGTHVAGIACGNGRGSEGRYRGVAYEADMLIVKLGRSVSESFPSTAQLMEGLDYIIKEAVSYNRPLSVNISFGNSYGSHTGHSLIETFINSAAGVGKTNICIGTGNEGDSGRHFQGTVKNEPERIRFIVGERQTSFNLQLWKYYYDQMEISMIGPDGGLIGPFDRRAGSQTYNLSSYTLYVYFGEPSPYSTYVEVYFVWIPNENYVPAGEWTIVLNPQRIVTGDVYLWFPTGSTLNNTTKFLQPSVEITLTIPSTTENAIAVGAYNSDTDSIASFSGRGFTVNRNIKPDIVAPGVDIVSSAPGGGYTSKTGTSMATPFVTGACALLHQWGIVQGNDPFLYGEKVKAYLIATARELPSFTLYPNETIGFGALCLKSPTEMNR